MKPITLFAIILALCFAGASLAAPPKKTKKPAVRPSVPLAPSLPALPSLTAAPLSAPTADVPAIADAPPAAGDIVLYNGQAVADAGLTLSGWGAGSVADSTDVSLSGSHSLKVTTLDPYQGAVLSFAKPVDVGSPNADKTRTLLLVVRPAAVTRRFPLAPAVPPASGSPAAPNDNSGDVTQGLLSAPVLARNAVWSGGRGRFRLAQYTQDVSGLSALQSLHLILTFTGGRQVDVVRPYPVPTNGESDRWGAVGIPLAALHLPDSPVSLQSMTLAGDDYAAFYVGQIKIVRDTAPLTCFAGDDQTAQPDQPVTLTATASGGLSALQYAWDFDASDGVSVQGEGRTVTTQYAKRGNYTVTLTVTDRDGLKKPAVSTSVVHVQ